MVSLVPSDDGKSITWFEGDEYGFNSNYFQCYPAEIENEEILLMLIVFNWKKLKQKDQEILINQMSFVFVLFFFVFFGVCLLLQKGQKKKQKNLTNHTHTHTKNRTKNTNKTKKTVAVNTKMITFYLLTFYPLIQHPKYLLIQVLYL